LTSGNIFTIQGVTVTVAGGAWKLGVMIGTDVGGLGGFGLGCALAATFVGRGDGDGPGDALVDGLPLGVRADGLTGSERGAILGARMQAPATTATTTIISGIHRRTRSAG
jgi:hypothetical protein